MAHPVSRFLRGFVAVAGLCLFGVSIVQLIWGERGAGNARVADSGRGDARDEASVEDDGGESSQKSVEADPYAGDSDELVVVIDPGHGGSDPGSVRDGHYEKDINLAVAMRLRARLREAGLRVVMTRSDDASLELRDRVAVANRYRNALFVSIHQNASVETEPSGAETYCAWPRPASVLKAQRKRYAIPAGFHHEDERGRRLAEIVQAKVCAATKAEDRGVKNRNFVVIHWVHGPAVLVECGFLSNPAERARLLAGDYQDKLAAGIARGILEYAAAVEGAPYFGVTFPKSAPPDAREPKRRSVVQTLPADA